MNERYNKVALHGSPLVSGGDGMQPAGYSGRLSGEWCGSAAGLEFGLFSIRKGTTDVK